MGGWIAGLCRRMRGGRGRVLFAVIVCFHILGALSSIRAIMETRTAQGTLAWVISLNTFPYVTVPAYWVFGQSKFHSYSIERQRAFDETAEISQYIKKLYVDGDLISRPGRTAPYLLEKIARLPYTSFNRCELLVDGTETFDAIFRSIDSATSYVLVQYYIVRDDNLGRELRDHLVRKAASGVSVRFLYDEIGSHGLSKSYIESLANAGVTILPFNTTKGKANRFQLNFRNHRKIVVVDGREAFVGGLNVGDEYMGRSPEYPNFRDTHMKLEGPAVQFVQLSFAEDWRWADGEILTNLKWRPDKATTGTQDVLCLPSGPADRFETCTMFFVDTINNARQRLWIATPYFVPDEQVMTALRLAALRGVDVRILVPEVNDNQLAKLFVYSILPECEAAGIRVLWYTPAFMHQKVLVADNDLSAIGTANFDNRSFRLNFEITMVVRDEAFNAATSSMLNTDLGRCRPALATEMTSASFVKRFAARATHLVAPVL